MSRSLTSFDTKDTTLVADAFTHLVSLQLYSTCRSSPLLSIFDRDNKHKQTNTFHRIEPSRACFFIRSHKALSYTLHAPVSPRVFYYALLHVQASATGPAILAATTNPPYCLRDTTTTTQPDTLREQASRIHPHHHHRFRPSTMRRFLTFRACRRYGGTSAASLPFCTR